MPSRAYRQGRTVSRVSFSIIAALFLVLSTSLAVGVATQLHRMSAAVPVSTVGTARYVVMLVLDGARPEYLHVAPMPHLDALRHAGVEYDRAFAGILESETPSGHAALSTGSTPARDGLLGFNWIAPNNSPVRTFDPDVVRGGAVERVMAQAGAPTIAALFKKRFPHARVVAVSGHKYYAADPLGGPAADYIMYYTGTPDGKFAPAFIPGHAPPASVLQAPGLVFPSSSHVPPGVEDHLAVQLALTAFRRVRQQVTLINLPEFDWPLGHVDGGDRARTRVLMQSFDRDLGQIEDAYRRAGVLDQTLFVVTADHGMTPLHALIPDTVLDNAVSKAGAISLETTYTTGGFIWLKDPATAQAVADNVLAAHDPHIQSVYYKVASKAGDSYVRAGGLTIPASADTANQYLLHSFLGGNAPSVVAFCTEDSGFVTQGAENWRGNHGGGSWDSQHIPLILSGPGIAQNVTSHAPARLEDVAPTLLTDMGVTPAGMQGTVLADSLTQPLPRQREAQLSVDRVVAPVADALRTQSLHEIGGR